jgi:hypothetical protein
VPGPFDFGYFDRGLVDPGLIDPGPDRVGIALGFNSTVAVEIDAAATNPAGAGARGGPGQDYVPVGGLSAVPGRLVAKKGRPPETAPGAPDVTRWWRFLTRSAADLDERHRLVYAEPSTGRTRHLYVVGQSCDAHQTGDFRWVDVVEYAL